MPVVRPGADGAATARKLIAEYGAENVTTRSEPGHGIVFVVPDSPEPAPEPKKAPAKKPSAEKPAAAGAAATD